MCVGFGLGVEPGHGLGDLEAFPLDGFPFTGDFLIGELLFESLLALLIGDLSAFQFLESLLDGGGVLFGLITGNHGHRGGCEEGKGEDSFHDSETSKCETLFLALSFNWMILL